MLDKTILLRVNPITKRELEEIGGALNLEVATLVRLAVYRLIDQYKDDIRRGGPDRLFPKLLQEAAGMRHRDGIIDTVAFIEGDPEGEKWLAKARKAAAFENKRAARKERKE